MKHQLPSFERTWMILALLLAVASNGHPSAMAQARAGATTPAASDPSALIFVENAGQFGDRARFQVRGAGPVMWLAEDAIWLTQLEKSATRSPAVGSRHTRAGPPALPERGVNVKLSFPGGNPHPLLEPFHRLETRVSFFKGSDPAQWQTGVPAWGGVRYVGLYPGIDLELSGQGGGLLARLVTRPGADLNAVQLRLEGVEAATVEGSALRLSTAAGEITIPLLRVEGSPSEAAVQRRGARVFEVVRPFAAEDSPTAGSRALVDDPSDLLYSTFLGGSSGEWGQGIAVDDSGAAYVTGATQSLDFPTIPGAFDTTFNGLHDAFVAKLSPDGSALEYATFLGGVDGDPAHAIAVDGSGAAYITGHTDCYDFPATPGAFDTTCYAIEWGGDAFVAKLSPDGSDLEYSTFLGGGIQEGGFGIAVDGSGAAYIMGVTGSDDFTVTAGAFDTSYNGGDSDAFVAKLNADGSDLEYATFLGGRGDEWSSGIAVDGSGAAYVTGETTSTDFPATPGSLDTSYNGGEYHGDAFVVKVNADGSALEYSTFLGGSGDDSGSGIAVDASGCAYVTGFTYSPDLPTTPGALDTTYGGSELIGDAFVIKLNPAGSALEYATFLGGSSGEVANGIALDGSRAAYVTGSTSSLDFPTTPGAFDPSYNGGTTDAFVARLNATGSALTYASFLGADGSEEGSAVAVDGSKAAYVVGTTSSPDFPTTPGAFDTSYNGDPGDAFVVKLDQTIYVYYLPLAFQNG